mmetsp:Transcript_15251/g.37709  ORF Transcript_15251/g.37709 Transcript_15251/m.37709 type:complete len:350 (-) Transcript_15251:92-1141(-)
MLLIAAAAAAVALLATARGAAACASHSADKMACEAADGCCYYHNDRGPRLMEHNGAFTCEECTTLDANDKAKLKGVLTAWQWTLGGGVDAFLDSVECPVDTPGKRIKCDDYGEVDTLFLFAAGLEGDIGWLCDIALDMPRVTHIVLKANKLYGTVPNCIQQVSALAQFDITYNNLRGPLPSLWPTDGTQGNLAPAACALVSDNTATADMVGAGIEDNNCFTCTNPEDNPQECRPTVLNAEGNPDGIVNLCNYQKGAAATCTPTDPAGTTTTRPPTTTPAPPTGGAPTPPTPGTPPTPAASPASPTANGGDNSMQGSQTPLGQSAASSLASTLSAVALAVAAVLVAAVAA